MTERTTAIVLFTDLVGSTELRSRLGEDAAETLRRQHDALVTDAVQANRGIVVKNLGDGFMATFAGAFDAVSSAVAIVLPAGVFMTTTPCSVAASTSTLSTPTPARPTTFNSGATLKTSAVIFVSDRTAIACTSFTSSNTFSGEEP